MTGLTRSRATFSRNLALISVVLHVGLLALLIALMMIRYEDTLLDLFLITVPVTAAYFLSAFTWLAKMDGRGERRKISWQASFAMIFVTVIVFAALYGLVILKFIGSIDAATAKIISGAIETAFAGALAVLTKEFFDDDD